LRIAVHASAPYKHRQGILGYFLLMSGLRLNSGCSALPNVSTVMNDAPATRHPRQIVAVDGLLSPQKKRRPHGTDEAGCQPYGHSGTPSCRGGVGYRGAIDQGEQGFAAHRWSGCLCRNVSSNAAGQEIISILKPLSLKTMSCAARFAEF